MLSGIILLAIGLLRLGTFIKYIPFPVTVGFTAGIALIIFASQLTELLGLTLAGKEPNMVWLLGLKTDVRPVILSSALQSTDHGPWPAAGSVVWSDRGMDRHRPSFWLGANLSFLIRDRDGAYDEIFMRRLRSIVIRDRPSLLAHPAKRIRRTDDQSIPGTHR
jgi:SulP family sulfate permease